MPTAKILSVFWHSVEGDFLSPDRENPSTSLFRKHLEFLAKNYTPISIFEFLQIGKQKRSTRSYPKPPLLLGFDDGFKNVIRNALPILEEYKAPAVFFVIGEILRDPDFVPWYVEINQLVRRLVRNKVMSGDMTTGPALPEEILKARRIFGAEFRACRSEGDRQRWLSHLASTLGSARPKGCDLDDDLRFVDRKDLADLTSPLLTVASHAMRHYDLATLSHDEQVEELEQSDFLLRQHCPSYCPVIAYPGGSFNADTISIARRVYKAGFGVLAGASYRNVYAYPRIGIEHHAVQELSYAVSFKRRHYLLPLKRVLHAAGIRPL